MSNYNGLKLKPLFHSEIASSYILWEIFNNHKEITKDFLKVHLGLHADEIVDVSREKNYRGKGFIDLMIQCISKGDPIFVLIEVKVHDYASATAGQILRYFDAANDEHDEKEIYFIYLTQYRSFDDSMKRKYALPGSIKEYQRAAKEVGKQSNYLKHYSWADFYHFIEKHQSLLSTEERLMLDLQKEWMTAKTKEDLESNQIEVGDRDLFDYFDDVSINPVKELQGKDLYKNNRHIYAIDLASYSKEELDKTLGLIKAFADSKRVERKDAKTTEDVTKEGVVHFLTELAQDEDSWKLLSFYSELFAFVDSTDYLLLNGTGKTGFSIKVKIKGKGMISLCTLWRNQTIEFSLKR